MASGSGQGRMSLSMKLIRLLIILFNLAFIVVGIFLLAIGVFVVRDPKLQQLRPLLNPDVQSAYAQSFSYIEVFAIAIIVIGGVLLAIGFLGCCGAVKGFRFLHVLYAIIIGGIIIVQIVIIVVFVTYQSRFKAELVLKLRESIATYYVGTPTNNSTAVNPVSLSWDFVQFNLFCCGAISKNDFSSATKWDRTNPYPPGENLTIPFTCCPLGLASNWNQLPTNLSAASACATTGTNAYTQGCYDRLLDVISSYKTKFIIGAAVVGVIELLALVFAIALYRREASYKTL